MKVNLDAYAGTRIDSLALLKSKPDGTTERLDRAASPQEITHGQYVWTDNYVNAYSDEVIEAGNRRPDGYEAGAVYYLSVAIQDDSDLDWDKTPGSIVDPLLITGTRPAASGVTVLETPLAIEPYDNSVTVPEQGDVYVFVLSDISEIKETDDYPEFANLSEETLGLLTSKVGLDDEGTLIAKAGPVIAGLSADERDEIDTAHVTPLPVFRALVDDGKTALVSMAMSLDAYAGKRLGSVLLLKSRADGTTVPLSPAASPEAITHGQYVWTDAGGSAILPEEAIETGETYYLSVAIRDNSELDWDSEDENGSVLDPLLITGTKSPGDPDDPYSESGGGCDTGAGLYGAALLALALAMRRRKAA